MAKRVSLSKHIPFLLYRLASRLSIEANEEFKALDVNTLSSRVLFVLLSREAATVGELSTITSIDQSTLSHILVRLGRKGFTTKRREGRDSRTVTVHLTAKGRKVALRCRDIGLAFERATTASMSVRQKGGLRAMLEEMYHNLTTSKRTEKGGEGRATSSSKIVAFNDGLGTERSKLQNARRRRGSRRSLGGGGR